MLAKVHMKRQNRLYFRNKKQTNGENYFTKANKKHSRT